MIYFAEKFFLMYVRTEFLQDESIVITLQFDTTKV